MTKQIDIHRTGGKLIRAAQYIRMSAEHQRYSPDNQRAAIAEYAMDRGFEIIKTYQDSGKSGLSLRGRTALKELLSDVFSGEAEYQAVLVLDVSRWGRFQDTDQAAHYEFMCRQAGVQIFYCGESFDNDGGAMASIVKNMKRVMAAEYSRELSTKVAKAQRLQASLGFKQGGGCPYGVRRQVIDVKGNRRKILKDGERKAHLTDRVTFAHGPRRETELVKQIYEAFVVRELRLGQIASWLNEMGHRQPTGNLWEWDSVRYLLENEIYIGQYVFGRKINNLGRPYDSAEEEWIRTEVMPPIVSREIFAAAQVRLASIKRRFWSDDEISDGLTRLFKSEGYLSAALIDACAYLPNSVTVAARFGSLTAAFRSVGVEPLSRFRLKSDGTPYSEEELLELLRRIHRERGYLSAAAIDADAEAPGSKYFAGRFGNLITAFRLAGFDVSLRSQQQAARQRQLESGARKTPRSPMRRNTDGTPFTDQHLIKMLQKLLERHGYLSLRLIDSDPTLPSAGMIARRLGGLRNAYNRVGYTGPRDQAPCDPG